MHGARNQERGAAGPGLLIRGAEVEGRAPLDVRVDGRRIVDEWRSAVNNQLRKMLLGAQRETEREPKQLIIERRKAVEASVKASQAAARADAADRQRLAADAGERLQRLETLTAELDELADRIRGHTSDDAGQNSPQP